MTRSIVFCSLERWDEVWRRNQYLIDGLLLRDPDLKVLFVQPPTDPLHALMARRRPRLGDGLTTVDGHDGRLWTLELTKWLPRLAGPLVDRELVLAVRRALRRLGWVEPGLLWINDPGWAPLVTNHSGPIVYDITDDWLEADRNDRALARLRSNENVLLQVADEVVVCSPALRASKGVWRPVVLIPNAVDVDRYRRIAKRPTDLPEGPTCVYVGTLHEDRLDVDLVVETAKSLSSIGGWVVLVGPNVLNAHNTALLTAEANVKLLGAKPQTAVPGYLQYASLLVVPHVVDTFTESLDPIKLYEYLAVGRPVLSTPVAGFRELAREPGIEVADRLQFSEHARALAGTWRPSTRHEGVADWSERVDVVEAVIARITCGPSAGPCADGYSSVDDQELA